MHKPLIKILTYVLDDEETILKFVKVAFDEAGIDNYQLFHNPHYMLAQFNDDVQICVLDVDLKTDMTGIDVMKAIRKMQPLCEVIFMSSQLSLDMVIDIVNEGGRTRFVRKDKRDFLETLVKHVKEAAIETDVKIRAVLNSAARIKETIEYFEKLRDDKIPSHN